MAFFKNLLNNLKNVLDLDLEDEDFSQENITYTEQDLKRKFQEGYAAAKKELEAKKASEAKKKLENTKKLKLCFALNMLTFQSFSFVTNRYATFIMNFFFHVLFIYCTHIFTRHYLHFLLLIAI